MKECFVLFSTITTIMTMTHHDYDVNGDDAEDEDKAKYEEYDDKK